MKRILFFLLLLCLENALHAQYIYTIKADSVKITNTCDTAELIIENHTQTVPGCLFNKGGGRTEFRRLLQRINDNLYLIGADTLKLNAWMQGGNSWGTIGVFGTMDNNPIDIYTNNTVRGRWTNTGNLLIGTTTDDIYKLNVSGGPAIFSDRLYVNSFTGDYTGQLYFKNAAGSFDSYIGTSGYDMSFHVRDVGNQYIYTFGNSTSTKFIIQGNDGTGRVKLASPNVHMVLEQVNLITDGTDPITITSNSYNTMDGVVVQRGERGTSMVDPIFTAREGTADVFKVLRNGNVGIGAPAPQAQLHTTGTVRFGGLTNDSSLNRVVVCDAFGNLAWRSASSLLAFSGTLNSDLAINGSVSAQKMFISQTGRWPDYVFSKQYQLPSLTEVENYINQNSHLPGIPAAAEIEKKGLDLGSNQAALLKKIEELTLYAIEQEKKSTEQEKKLQRQSEEISELKNQNKELEMLKQQMADLKALIKNTNQPVK